VSILLYFLPLSLVISLVLSATKKDGTREIALQAGKLFVLLSVGTVAFSVVLHFCAKVPFLLFVFLGAIVAVLAFFTLKGAVDWLWSLGGGKGVDEEESGEPEQGP